MKYLIVTEKSTEERKKRDVTVGCELEILAVQEA